MSLPQVLIDTDILSALMRKHPAVVARGKAYLAEHGQFTLSVITRYEILRGLKAKAAHQQATAFERFCAGNLVLPMIGDADILIAASALAHGLGVTTNNEQHFRQVTGLHVENWLK
jgi:tRNA(fMet)-specific endonuclease VapC